MTDKYSETVETAREYYNSSDADTFYYTIWGGEDLHLGIYESENEPIFDASRRTVQQMASKLSNLDENSRVLDVGAGYGGSMRYIAATYGCRCVALNLSEVENKRDRQMNAEQGLDRLIDVVDGDFKNLPYEDGSFDIVWCQDSFLHSDDREKVVSECARVLKAGGEFIFTDPMQTDDAPTDKLQPIYDRIHLESMGSPGFYREIAPKYGFREVEFDDHSPQLPRHYGRVLKELEAREDEVRAAGVSQDYIDRMKTGLGHWVEGGNNGYLRWGIFHFRKE